MTDDVAKALARVRAWARSTKHGFAASEVLDLCDTIEREQPAPSEDVRVALAWIRGRADEWRHGATSVKSHHLPLKHVYRWLDEVERALPPTDREVEAPSEDARDAAKWRRLKRWSERSTGHLIVDLVVVLAHIEREVDAERAGGT